MHIDINLPASSQSGRQAGGRRHGGCGGVAQSTADGNRNGNGNVNILATTRGIGLPHPSSLLLQLDNSIFVYLWLLLCNSFYSFCSFTFPISHFPFPICPFPKQMLCEAIKIKVNVLATADCKGDRLSDRWRDRATEICIYRDREN